MVYKIHAGRRPTSRPTFRIGRNWTNEVVRGGRPVSHSRQAPIAPVHYGARPAVIVPCDTMTPRKLLRWFARRAGQAAAWTALPSDARSAGVAPVRFRLDPYRRNHSFGFRAKLAAMHVGRQMTTRPRPFLEVMEIADRPVRRPYVTMPSSGCQRRSGTRPCPPMRRLQAPVQLSGSGSYLPVFTCASGNLMRRNAGLRAGEQRLMVLAGQRHSARTARCRCRGRKGPPWCGERQRHR